MCPFSLSLSSSIFIFFSFLFQDKNQYPVFLQLCCDFWGYNNIGNWAGVCFLTLTLIYLILSDKPLISRKCTSVRPNILLQDIIKTSGFVRLKRGLDTYKCKNSIRSYANEDKSKWGPSVIMLQGISCSPVGVRNICLFAMFKCWPEALWVSVREFKTSERGCFQSSYQMMQ